jgi:hypothetical protein
MNKKRLTQKRKDILLPALSSNWAIQALFNVDDFASAYEDTYDDKGFKEQNGFTVEEAVDALEALVDHLS